MNDCVKLILILIAVLVLFTFVTGAHKETEHFTNAECDKDYMRENPITCPTGCPVLLPLAKNKRICDNNNNNCKYKTIKGWKCQKNEN